MSDTKIWNAIDSVTIKDLTNDYELDITFDAQKDDRPSGFSGMFSADPQPTETGGLQFRRDLLAIEIV